MVVQVVGTWGVPLVVTMHDIIHERFSEMFPANDRTSSLKGAAIERADHVICISNSAQNDLLEFSATPEEKISVVYHESEGFELAQCTTGLRPRRSAVPPIYWADCARNTLPIYEKFV